MTWKILEMEEIVQWTSKQRLTSWYFLKGWKKPFWCIGRGLSGKDCLATKRVDMMGKKTKTFTGWYLRSLKTLLKTSAPLKTILTHFSATPICTPWTTQEFKSFRLQNHSRFCFERPNFLWKVGKKPKYYLKKTLFKQHLNPFNSHTIFTTPTVSAKTTPNVHRHQVLFVKAEGNFWRLMLDEFSTDSVWPLLTHPNWCCFFSPIKKLPGPFKLCFIV